MMMQLTKEQTSVVNSQGKKILVLASAGSGKTTIIIQRIKELLARNVPADNILALTFANKAAQNIRNRILSDSGIHGEGVTVRTFHSFGLKLIREYYSEFGLKSDVRIATDTDLKKLFDPKKIDFNSLKNLVNNIKIRRVQRLDFNYGQDKYVDEFMLKMTNENLVDIEDMLYLPIKLLKDNPKIREELQNRYRYIFVDEYQDTNVEQNNFIDFLVNKDTNVCFVGDDDQAIYEWRGSNPQYIRDKADSGEYEVHKLETNFRSQQMIVETADTLIHKNKKRTEKSILPFREPGIKPIFHRLDSAAKEAEYIADTIKKLIDEDKYYPSDIAVLVRMNDQCGNICAALEKRNIAYNYCRERDDNSSYRSVVSILRSIIYDENTDDLSNALNFPDRILDQRIFNEAKHNYLSNNPDVEESLGPLEWLKLLYESNIKFQNSEQFRERYKLISIVKSAEIFSPEYVLTMYVKYMEEYKYKEKFPEAYSFILQVYDIAKNYEETYPEATLKDFIDHLRLTIEQETSYRNNDLDSVNILTIHKAKGMEYKVVFIPGIQAGLFPMNQKTLYDVEGERRLFYVAITRAKDILIMTSFADPLGGILFSQTVTHGFMAEIPKISYINAEEFEAKFKQLSKRPERPDIKPISESVDEKINAFIEKDRQETIKAENEAKEQAKSEEAKGQINELTDLTSDELDQTLSAGGNQYQDALIAMSNDIKIPQNSFVVIIGDSGIDDMVIRKALKKTRISAYERYDYDGSNLKGSGKINTGKYFNNNRCIGIILGPNAHKQQGVETSSLKPKLQQPGFPFLVDLIDEKITKTSLTNAIIKIKHNYAEEQKKLPSMK
jgi:Superfamily I DNA and RNA helicases